MLKSSRSFKVESKQSLVLLGRELKAGIQLLYEPYVPVAGRDHLELGLCLGRAVPVNPGVLVTFGSSPVGSAVHPAPFPATNGR